MSAAPRVNELGGNDHTRISDLHEGKAGWKKYKHMLEEAENYFKENNFQLQN